MSAAGDPQPSGGGVRASGSLVALVIAATAALGGGVIYYLQNFEHYKPVTGLTEISIGGARFGVSDYDGLDHDGWPMRLRGCFKLSDPEGALAAGRATARAEPFGAPDWFECWNAAEIDADLKAGRAKAVIAETTGEGEFTRERIVVVYPDGRAFQWRRLQKDGAR